MTRIGDKRVFELVVKVKLAAVVVLVQDRPEKFAESEVLANQRNQDNRGVRKTVLKSKT